MSPQHPFTDVPDAIEEIRAGRMIIVVDDEDRENEGDLTLAAEKVTPEAINFMAKFGRGLVCLAMTEERLEHLNIGPMTSENTSQFGTAFCEAIDARTGVTTGISAHDRARTIQVAIDPATKPSDLARPGHMFPLRARKGGVLVRAGQTEAVVDFARLAGFRPGGVLYDLGANVGWYTLLGSALGASHIYSFEPLPSNVAILREHLRLNRIKNYGLFEAAVGQAAGTARFEVGKSNSIGHLSGRNSDDGIEVQVVALDGLIESEGLRPPDVIKCDIEGAELDALHGARRTLEEHGPTILLATHTRALHRNCRDYLQALGYSTEAIPGAPFEDEMVAWRMDRERSRPGKESARSYGCPPHYE